MSRFSSLLAPIRKNLLERSSNHSDPFQPLDTPAPRPLRLTAPVGPGVRNRPADVLSVATALKGAGFPGLDRETGQNERRPQPPGVFDTPLENAVRGFQRRHKLKVDGLLVPKGPTQQALGQILQRSTAKRSPAPPLAGLSGAAMSANTRLVRHLMGTRNDGLVPSLMASDFRSNEAGRAKTADFLSQLFARDPKRAKSLRAQAGGLMSAGEKTLLDKLILQARKADAKAQPPGDPDDDEPGEPEEPTPDDPGQDDPDEPEEPEPEDPPKKPEPDEEKCKRLKAELANAEQAAEEAAERMRKAAEDYSKKSRDVEARWQEFKQQAAAFGIGNIASIIDLRKGKIPRGITLPSEVMDALAAYRKAFQESTEALEKQKAAQAELDAKEDEVKEIREKINSNSCG